jgi:hypothetical protein
MHNLNEGLKEELKTIYYEFEKYIKAHNMTFDISVDEGGYQSYFVPKDHADKIPALTDYIDIACDKNGVHMKTEKSKRGTQFTFSIAALNELEEDQYKSPTRKVLRDQSAFPSSFGPSKTFGGISKYNGTKRKKKLSENIDEALENL